MEQEVRLRARPFILAIAAAVLFVLSAPFVGQVRSYIRAAFPGHFVQIVGGIIAAGVVVALAAACVRIRDRRVVRYAAIAAAVGIAIAYSAVTAGPNPESNAVERFHFLQYGLITFLFYRAWRPSGDVSILLLPALAGLIVGTAEEWLQWFIPNRVGEMNDVLLNLVAIVSGLCFSVGVEPPDRMAVPLRPQSRRRVLRMAAATVAVFAVFVQIVHLGYLVDDPEVGFFGSRFTQERLLALQAERAASWQTRPPPTHVVRLSREDQYLTEGIQHVRQRNLLWTEGDVHGAWLENRILEKYYAPVLDTPTYEGREGHRWPEVQRTDAAVRLAAAPGYRSYVSGAYPYRLLFWNRLAFWLVVVGLVVSLLLFAQRA